MESNVAIPFHALDTSSCIFSFADGAGEFVTGGRYFIKLRDWLQVFDAFKSHFWYPQGTKDMSPSSEFEIRLLS